MKKLKLPSFKNKTLLITGGTGSFGNRMLRYFLNNTDVKEIRIFSRDEEKQYHMRNEIKSTRVKYFIGDIRNLDSIIQASSEVDFLFHAAALKQVPSCEFFPMEAIRTNIIGAENLLTAAIENRISKVVMLSTDKAVYPINAMGMTKALMEKLMIAKSRDVDPKVTTLCATRYGNVMASRGSVIPLFIKQIKEGSEITITNPEMTRFLLSLSDSVNLVLYAFKNAKGGDIFIQKAPACTILNLATALLKIFNAKSKIKIIGTRHGEKKHETLVTCEEMSKAEDLDTFFRVPADNRDLNYSKYFSKGIKLARNIDEFNSSNTEQLNVEQVINKLIKLDYIQRELKG